MAEQKKPEEQTEKPASQPEDNLAQTQEYQQNSATGAENDSAVPDSDEQERAKDTTEKIWDSTKQAWTTATFKAGQYKRLVQKKIDLSALHKKIGVAHSDLGKLIDDLREAGRKSIMTQTEVKEMLQHLDSLKAAAAALEEEIENIKEQEPPPNLQNSEDKS
ncbi:MAG TPA: hypothetical protein VJ904_02685 [Tichowtungia sp.]|nr:hypothetical protein [Tichowtungia sp.]HKL27192.1 hypothetical protein [Desulfuromonadales bacterium]